MIKPTAVRAKKKYTLWIQFSNGVEGIIDFSYLVGKGIFSLWNDEKTFSRVYIDEEKRAISWSPEVEICVDTLYLKITGKEPEDLFPNLKKVSAST